MAGWVGTIGEDMFGPAGGNEEIDQIREAITKLETDTAEKIAGIKTGSEAQIAALMKRIDKVCEAVGPRAARI